jgi:SAM-dependent methyltransferase
VPKPLLTLRRLLHAVDNHGLAGVLQRLYSKGRAQHPAAGDFAPAAPPHPFDLERGADTSGYTPGEQLSSGHAADFFNTAFYAISPSTLRQALAELPEPCAAVTFVDLGCGKGRALLVAQEFGFAHVVGVELAPDLAVIASSNLNRAGMGGRAEIVTGDASSFRYPEGPLVVFLYHPFLARVLRQTLDNLRDQLAERPRRVYLLRANPGYPRVLARQRFLHLTWRRAFQLSPEDAAADRHGTVVERYELWRTET